MKYLISTNLKNCHHKFPRYYSLQNETNDKSLLGFTNKKDAVKFTKYLIEQKCLTNKWPTLNMSTAKYTIKENEQFKCHIPQFVAKFVYLVEWDDDDLNRYLALNHVNLIIAENFKVQNSQIKMNIGERHLKYNNETRIKENLENNYIY